MRLSELIETIAGDPPSSAFYGTSSVYANHPVGWPLEKEKGDLTVSDTKGKVVWKTTSQMAHELVNGGKIRWHDNESVIKYLLMLGIL